MVEAAIPPGAFDATTALTLNPIPVDTTNADFASFDVTSSFELKLEGKVARRDIQLRLDAAGFDPAKQEAILVRWVEFQGERHPEFVSQLALEGGKLATQVPALVLDGSPSKAARKDHGRAASAAGTNDPLSTDRIPGVRRDGVFAVFRTNVLGMAYFATLASSGGLIGAVSGVSGYADFVYVAYDLDDYPMVLVVKPGQEFRFDLIDPATGIVQFTRRYPPIDAGHGASDTGPLAGRGPLWVTAARPARTLRFQTVAMTGTVAAGITATAIASDADHDGIPDTTSFPVSLHGDARAVPAKAWLRLLDGLTGSALETTAKDDGSFDLGDAKTGVDAGLGHSLLLSIESREVDPSAPISVEFDRPVLATMVQAGTSLADSAGRTVALAAAGSGRSFTLKPARLLDLGETYTLRVQLDSTDPTTGAPDMPGAFLGRFATQGTHAAGTAALADPNDEVKVGAMLFVAAGKDGLAMLDASTPGRLDRIASQPTRGTARGVAAWWEEASSALPRRLRIALAGGGDAEPGFLRLYDVGDDPKSQPPYSLSLSAAEFASSRLGSTDAERFENLGDGVPLRVRVLHTSYGSVEHTIAFVSTLGLGLELVDLEKMASKTETQPPRKPAAIVGVRAADDLRDVAVLPRRRVLGETPDGSFVAARDASGAVQGLADTSFAWDPAADPSQVRVLGLKGAVPGEVRVKLHDTRSGAVVATTSNPDGSFEVPPTPDFVIKKGDTVEVVVTHEEAEVLALLARSANGLEVVNATDPAIPQLLARLAIEGEVRAVRVFPAFPLPAADGSTHPTDLAFVVSRTAGLVVVDLTDERNPRRVGTLALPGEAFDLAFDARSLRAVVNLGAEGTALLDISKPNATSTDRDALVLARLPADGGIDNTGLAADFDLGEVYASSQGKGVTATRFGTPVPRFVSDPPPGASGYTDWPEIVPLGVPLPAGRPGNAALRVALALPGGIGPRLYVAVEPLSAYGSPMRDQSWPAVPGRSTAIQGSLPLLALGRKSDDKLSPDYNLYLCDPPLTFTADPGARSAKLDAVHVATGDLVRARLLAADEHKQSDGPDLSWLAPSELERISTSLRSWRMDLVPAPSPAPANGASAGRGDVVGLWLHSGEFHWEETDLSVPGRAMPFAFARGTRSFARWAGPLGKGWDSPYLARVMLLPTGDLWYWDGTGARWTFPRLPSPKAGRTHASPEGVDLSLRQDERGYLFASPSGALASFNVEGDLESLADAHGNSFSFYRDAAGRLDAIQDDLGRLYRIGWSAAGRISSLSDFGGRTVTYAYDRDDPSLLASATRFGRYVTKYGYESVVAAARGQLKTLTDELDQRWLENTFDGLGRVTRQHWGDPAKAADEVRIQYQTPRKVDTTVTDRNGHVAVYTHARGNRLVQMVEKDPVGADAVTTFDYDTLGRLKTTARPEGEMTVLVYESDDPAQDPLRRGDVVTERHLPRPDSAEVEETVTRVFNAANDLEAETDARGKTRSYQYDAKRSLVLAVSPRGRIDRFERNAYGQVTRETLAEGTPEELVTSYAYWPASMPGGKIATRPDPGLDAATGGYPRSITVDPKGLALATLTEYDAFGRPTLATDPRGTKTLREYDPRGLLTREVRDWGGFDYATRFEYDDRGLGTKTTIESKTSDPTVVVEAHADVLGFRTSSTVTGPGLPAAGVVTLFAPDPDRNVQVVTHPLGWTETFERDARDQVTAVTRAAGSLVTATHSSYDRDGAVLTSTDAMGKVTTSVYDGHGRLARTVSPRGLWTERAYWPGGLLRDEKSTRPPDTSRGEKDRVVLHETSLLYDDLGWLSSRTEGPDPLATESFVPDRLGHVLERHDRRGKVWLSSYFPTGWKKSDTDPLSNLTSFTYTKQGNVETVTADGLTSTRHYDALGRLTEDIDPAGHTTRHGHDERDNLVQIIDAERHATSFSFDALNRLLAETGPEGETVTRAYDLEGGLATFTDARNNVTSYGHDGLGRLTSLTPAGLAATTYTLDDAGRSATETTPRGFASTFSYDDDGNLIGREVKLGKDVVESETYAHDLLGRLTLAENGSASVEREVDSFGDVNTETVTVKGTSPLRRTLRRTFDSGLLLASLLYPGGRSLAYAPDDAGRFATLASGSRTLLTHRYEGPSRVTSKTLGDAGALVVNYGYDSLERALDSWSLASGSKLLASTSLAVSPRHLLAAETDQLARSSRSLFDYDTAGRLTSAALGVPAKKTRDSALLRSSFTLDPVRNWTADEEYAGGPYKRTTLADPGPGNRYASIAGAALGYDPDGNLATDDLSRSFEFDWAGRLVRVTSPSVDVSYAYDPFGRKLARTDRAGTPLYGYDADSLIEETDGSGALAREIIHGSGPDSPSFLIAPDGTERRLLPDRSGAVTALADSSGRILERYTYSPYGKLHRSAPERIEQARLEGSSLVLRATGALDLASLSESGNVRFTPSIAGKWSIGDDGREASFLPDDADKDGLPDWPRGPKTSVTLTIARQVRASTGIELSEPRSITFDAGDLADRVLGDWQPPAIERATQDADGTLSVVFSEPVKDESLDSAFTLTLSGKSDPVPFTAARQSDRRTVLLTPREKLTPAESYTLSVLAASVKDLSDQPAPSAAWTWTTDETPTRIFDTWETPPAQASLLGNEFFFASRPLDPATGLYDFRARWLDPHLARWISPDPLGHPDGPNAYAAFAAHPVNNRDPEGTVAIADNLVGGAVGVGIGWGIAAWRGEHYTGRDAAVDFAIGFASSGLGSFAKAAKLGWAAKGALVLGGEGGLSALGAGAHAGIHGDAIDGAYLEQSFAVGVGGYLAGRAAQPLLGAAGRGVGRLGRSIGDGMDEWAAEALSGIRLNSFPANLEDSAARAWRSLRRLGSRVSELGLPDEPADRLLGEYRRVRGHHVHAKSALEGHLTYDPAKGFSIGPEFLESMGWSHPKMTAMQRKLFHELAASSRPNTIFEHNRIAVEALIAGGATREEARALVAASLHNLRAQGVAGPTGIPWAR